MRMLLQELELQLSRFGEHLLKRHLAGERHARFYVYWVRKFLVEVPEDVKLSLQERLEGFLVSMRSAGRFEDWQVDQAERALRLYFNNFLGETTWHSVGAAKVAPKANGAYDPPDVLSAMRDLLRLKHYSYRTEQTYVEWADRFFRYLKETVSSDVADCSVTPQGVKDFLAWLALRRSVSASTQNQAFSALLFMCSEVLHLDLGDLQQGVRAKRGKRLPVVFTMDEVGALFRHLGGRARLMAQVIYGGGLRVMECCRLRVKDVDFDNNLLFVRSGKGDKDRSTLLAESVKEDLRTHLVGVRAIFDKDRAAGVEGVAMPDALDRKYPDACREWGWFWVFPSAHFSTDPRTGKVRRHHVSDMCIQRAVKDALKKAEVLKPGSVHTLRHTFATQLLLHGVDIRQIQDYLGHANVETTMVYTHVVKDFRAPAKSPLDMVG